MAEPPDQGVAAVAALDEPTRRRVYEHVARQLQPVSRDATAAALQLPRTTAAFHLDRLVAAGLLEVGYERLTGRTGPGAGRPAKLYHRSRRTVAVSLPQRHYELAGRLLAAAVEEAERSGEPTRAVLARHATDLGRQLGQAAHRGTGTTDDGDPVWQALEEYGFEPRQEASEVVLGNCPFHALAERHTALVCGMNLCLLTGLLDGLAATGMRARLDPLPGHCCVRLSLR